MVEVKGGYGAVYLCSLCAAARLYYLKGLVYLKLKKELPNALSELSARLHIIAKFMDKLEDKLRQDMTLFLEEPCKGLIVL